MWIYCYNPYELIDMEIMRLNLTQILLVNLLIAVILYTSGVMEFAGLCFFGFIIMVFALIKQIRIVLIVICLSLFMLPVLMIFQNEFWLLVWGYIMMISGIIFSLAMYREIIRNEK